MRFLREQVATEWDGAWCCDKCWTAQHWKKEAFVDEHSGRKLCEKCAGEERE